MPNLRSQSSHWWKLVRSSLVALTAPSFNPVNIWRKGGRKGDRNTGIDRQQPLVFAAADSTYRLISYTNRVDHVLVTAVHLK